MKSIIIILWLISCTPFAALQPYYTHKSESELARMTPAQRVDQFAEEQANHKYNMGDEQELLIRNYLQHDGLAGLPQMISIINEYDPPHSEGMRDYAGLRFDAMWILMEYLDDNVVRLRGSEEGRRAMDALARAIGRMRAAGYGQPKQDDWPRHGRFNLAVMYLKEAKGLSMITDPAISDTLRLEYKIELTKGELVAFVNFLVKHYPQYPSWSETNEIKDNTRLNEAGNPAQIHVFKNPERFHEAYLEFKKSKG
jgi:hypothetical protein